ncbi:hypothetical protein ACJRO7_008894 [Eucalyptus globulus]|uniref:Uncharacterized protein n=1 Tax=Eucalyptus globulus TaxID=34317 RepID=A0ABD3ITA1_EUCGL
MKLLISKVVVGAAILLFLVGTMVQPNEAYRVLIKGKEEGCADDKPSVPVLQVLQKGPVRPPGTPGYTPGVDTTNTRAFAGHAVAPPHGYSDRIPKSSVATDRK